MMAMVETPAPERSQKKRRRDADAMKASFRPKKFYSAKDEEWKKKMEALWDRCVIWEEYWKQEQALRAVDQSSFPLKVFSFEHDAKNPGRRKFLTSTYEDFWRRYVQMDAKDRVFYELIREGDPCRLYFDLEFPKVKGNSSIDVERMMHNFKALVVEHLNATFSLSVSVSSDIVDLDSSTESKFSRHLIVHTTGAVFKDNGHVGRFVSKICKNMSSRCAYLKSLDVPSDEERTELEVLLEFFVFPDDDESSPKRLFIDEGVYSKNRNFRIYLSKKIGKTRHLEVSAKSAMQPPSTPLSPRDDTFFLSTLVCAVTVNKGTRLLTVDPSGTGCSEVASVAADSLRPSRGSAGDHPLAENRSPFPLLEDYIVDWINANTEAAGQAKIKSVLWFSTSNTMVVSIVGNRYCFNIGREHKSNAVYYFADLKRMKCCQRCHDPDCKYFNSHEFDIPQDLTVTTNKET